MANRPISDVDQPDPWLLRSPHHTSLYYLTFTLGNRIEIWSSPSMHNFQSNHVHKTTVYAPRTNVDPWSCDIWAPELHYINGTWYVYAAACMPGAGNAGHRTIVLQCDGEDPMRGDGWRFVGPLKGLPGDQWSIDGTVFSPDRGQTLYCCYSGWPLGDFSDTQQDLFLVRLRSPIEAEEGSLTCIGRAELEWERPEGGRRGVNEGPTWLEVSGWRGIVFSAHGSWTCEYKLGLLKYIGGSDEDMCNAKLWQKRPVPLLVSDKAMGGPFGPGHASFVADSEGGSAVFCVYHGTEKEDEGWANRKARILSLEPSCFADNARPVCCSYRTHHHESQVEQSSFSRLGDEVEKRVPPQYRGIFDKAKKFFH